MKTWTGKVEKQFERDFQGTKLYSFKLEGVDRWFRTGKERLTANEGDTITFTEKNNQVIPESVTETQSASSTEETEPTAATPTSTTGPTVGQRMAWENARRDATRIVVAALQTEVLPWNKNTPKNQRLDLLVGYVNQIAKDLLEPQD